MVVLIAALAAGAGMAQAQDKLKLVASFSIIADFARNVGGDRIDISTLVGPGSDAHVYTPTPADARNVAAAKLVIVNGLGFEGWLARLVKSAGNKSTIVTATKGIAARKDKTDAHGHGHDHGDADPHAWQSVANAKVYVANIRDALVAADPAGAADYRANAEGYLAKLDALDREVRDAMVQIPAERRKVISTHDAFGYFADAYGIAFIAPQGVSTEAEATARDVARIITQIRAQKIPAVFLENVSDPRLMRRVSQESGAKLGGTLFSDALTDEKGSAPTYIDMIRYNIKALTSALAD
ncbi:metal ABC transporter substrate-binding protein [Bradyrhizobium sp. LHD-71]|uniref:metal ABC transporter substrate-binding protein n=1 Tax=Bradyrhizobium sp. LHD-71 TaxID=3072141 RepID=UPI00280EA2E9|nr:metal ABC transporter substrate-binding protein [Bradyrhizobium sp. LHD-71]MDQ8728953.1 metal ABC transporter substrate-binding protein [Bradyrhizobium sp. LHD-71]